jgi:hypothetical protein
MDFPQDAHPDVVDKHGEFNDQSPMDSVGN